MGHLDRYLNCIYNLWSFPTFTALAFMELSSVLKVSVLFLVIHFTQCYYSSQHLLVSIMVCNMWKVKYFQQEIGATTPGEMVIVLFSNRWNLRIKDMLGQGDLSFTFIQSAL